MEAHFRWKGHHQCSAEADLVPVALQTQAGSASLQDGEHSPGLGQGWAGQAPGVP